jgi:hypothetical protein
MIIELPNFVDSEKLNTINSFFESYISNKKFGIKEDSYRDGTSIPISHIKELEEIDNLLQGIFGSRKLLGRIERRYRPEYSTGDSGYEFHRYYPGQICHIHGDSEIPTVKSKGESLLRFASVVMHLNTPSNGAELVFPELDKTVKTEAGKIVVFPPYNFAQHYTTASTDNRDVIVTWFVYDKIRAVNV